MVNTPNATVHAPPPPPPIDDDRPEEVVGSAGEGDGSPAVSLAAISKVFGTRSDATPALDRVSLTVERGEFVCVLGASGCGKSTLLNLVAGLDRPSAGTLEVATERPALMFQEAALFPWLTAQGNVELALKLDGTPKAERRARVHELLTLVNLGEFGARRPHELSGGMRQRVALARALAQRSDLLLMDEPFGALDAMTRDLLHDELEALWTSTDLTVLFVTHNVREAVRLGDRVILLSSRPGRVAHEYPIDIPRPRRIDSPEVASLAAEITDRLREEVRRHGDDNR
jgi:NitT/TauT family transport system ATP-binding protein